MGTAFNTYRKDRLGDLARGRIIIIIIIIIIIKSIVPSRSIGCL